MSDKQGGHFEELLQWSTKSVFLHLLAFVKYRLPTDFKHLPCSNSFYTSKLLKLDIFNN